MVELCSKQNDVLGGTLSLRAGSAGLRLHIADVALIEGNCEIRISSSSSSIEFGKFPANSMAKIMIPYSLETDMKTIEVRNTVSYTTSQGTFIYGTSEKISSVLSLGVNVQDIFKREALFSKFAISASTGIPLRIKQCHLQDSVDFETTSPALDKKGLTVFSKQPLSMVYKIRLRVAARSLDPARDGLKLQIQYQCLDEEIIAAVVEALVTALATSPYKAFERLLTSFLQTTIQRLIQLQDFEYIGLLREFELGPASGLNWNEVLHAISPTQRMGLVQWLNNWHQVYTLSSFYPYISNSLHRHTPPSLFLP